MSRNHGNRIHHVFAAYKTLECVDYIRTVAESKQMLESTLRKQSKLFY